jgi:hypothetical protein
VEPSGTNEQEIILTITYKQDGVVEVSGPIANKVLAYGLLESAKDVIAEHHKSLRKPVSTKGGILSFARNL